MITDSELPSITQLSVRYSARSHPGSLASNEDSCGVSRLAGASLLVVADGAGGHAGGEVASDIVVRAIKSHFEKLGGAFKPGADPVAASLRAAQAALRSAISSRPRLHDMRSTGLVVLATPTRAWIGHVGDSRAYLVRDTAIRQLTRDDTMVQALVEMGQLTREKARTHSKSNVLLQSLGQPRDDLDFHVSEPLEMRAGDMIVACSDGLTDVVSEAQIVTEARGPSRAVAERLLDLAIKGGAPDNVTVAVLSWRRSRGKMPPSIAAQSARGRRRARGNDRFRTIAMVLLAVATIALLAAVLMRRSGRAESGRAGIQLPQ